MKKVLFFILIYFILSSVVFAVQEVTIATHDKLHPFTMRSADGKLTGVYIEIVKKAVSRMPDYRVTFKVVPWARAKKEVGKGVVFAILPPYFHAHDWMTETEPKRPYIWPYSLSLLKQQDIVVCNEKVMTVQGGGYPEDFKGLKFVMTRGDGRAGEAFTRMVKEKKIDLSLVNDMKLIFPYMLAEMADCTVVSKVPFAWYMKKMKETGEYQKFDRKGVILKEIVVISNNDGFLGYTDIDDEKNFPFKKDFSIKFDIEIYKMKKNGEIQEIIGRYVK